MHGPDQTAVSVMAQDVVSVSAIVFATAALTLSQLTGAVWMDAVGSIGVGLSLGWLAYYLGSRNIAMLNGQSVPRAQIDVLSTILKQDPVVDQAYGLQAVYLGPGNVTVSADIDFDGKAIARRYIERDR
jgi:zinc transporter 9